MLSARQWIANRSLGRALVFWLWLGSFVFGFAARDCFHGATCPQQALFNSAGHADHALVQAGSHDMGADMDCSACAVALVALALVALSVQQVLLLCFALAKAPFVRLKSSFSPALAIARGPPALA